MKMRDHLISIPGSSRIVFTSACLFLVLLLMGAAHAHAQDMAERASLPPLPPADSASLPDGMTALGQKMDVIAEDDAPEKEILKRAAEEIRAELIRMENEKIYVPSLFFSEKEQKVLDEVLRRSNSRSANLARDALDGVGTVSDEILAKLQEEDRLKEMQRLADERIKKNIPQVLVMGGIMYKKDGDWAIWLNNHLVTPRSQPEEITEIKVTKDFVELKWKDPLTGRIYPVRMRPNQSYDMATGTFYQGIVTQ